MEDKTGFIEPLLERVQQYGKTSLELVKLQAIDKTSDVASTLISRMLLLIFVSFFALTLNIAVGLWLGDLLGKNYYGFLVVAAFYGIIGCVLYALHPSIKSSVNNSIISQFRN